MIDTIILSINNDHDSWHYEGTIFVHKSGVKIKAEYLEKEIIFQSASCAYQMSLYEYKKVSRAIKTWKQQEILNMLTS